MSFEFKMIIIYTIIFVIIGLFIWLYIITKNKREEDKINKDIDFSNDNDDPEDDTLSNYEDYVHRGLGTPKKSDDYVTDEIDDFINNFTYRDSEYEDIIQENLDKLDNDTRAKEELMEEAKNIPNNFEYTMSITPIKVTNNISEVLNVLIGNKAYIFLANGNKLSNGEKIILSIDNKNYPGVVVKSNYSRDLSSLKILPKPLIVVKKID